MGTRKNPRHTRSRRSEQATSQRTGSWTATELRNLRDLAGLPLTQVAATLNRSITSIRSAAQRQRISLRPAGEHRGRVLHEPRSGGLTQRSNDPRVAAEVTIRLAGELPPDCSRCGRWPQQPSGICRVCRLAEINASYRAAREHNAAIDEQRRISARLRQRAHRGQLDHDLALDERLAPSNAAGSEISLDELEPRG